MNHHIEVVNSNIKYPIIFYNHFFIYIVNLTFCYGITINIFLNINNLNVIYQ